MKFRKCGWRRFISIMWKYRHASMGWRWRWARRLEFLLELIICSEWDDHRSLRRNTCEVCGKWTHRWSEFFLRFACPKCQTMLWAKHNAAFAAERVVG